MPKVVYITRSAALSSDARFRYELIRQWDSNNRSVAFILLNPSTADSAEDDNTIRRCVGFAQRWGYGGIVIYNLYAYRTRYPQELKAARYPVGPDNDTWLKKLADSRMDIVAAWGVHAQNDRVQDVVKLINRPMMCISVNADGSPSHPLMLSYQTQRRAWTSKS